MNVKKLYLNEIRHNLGYQATWLPGRRMNLGDVGIFDDGSFEPVTTLAELGVEFKVNRDSHPKDYAHRSAGRVTLEVKAAGTPSKVPGLADAEAGVVISGGAEACVFFDARACTISSIANMNDVGTSLLALHRVGRWRGEYRLVGEVVNAGSTTIVLLEGQNGHLTLRAKAGTNPAVIARGEVDAGMSVAHEHSVGFSVVAEVGLVPLFTAWGVKKRVFGADAFRPKRLADTGDEERVVAEADDFVFDITAD